MKLTPEQRAALAAFLLSRFRAIVRAKDVVEMVVVAAVFGVAALVGAQVPDAEAFRTRWWTTLGPVIYAPPGRSDALGEYLRVLAHELSHVVAFWRSPVDLVRRYLTKKGRAELEAEAERGACELWWLLTGTLPEDLAAIDVTRHGYAFEDLPGEHDDHADLTRNLLEQSVTSIQRGVLSTDVGLATLVWLRQHAPTAIVGRVA